MSGFSFPKSMLGGALLVVSQTLVLGAEARIPIHGPTTISAPGHYFVTQNFSVASGSAIRILASNVVVDLNGRTLTHTSTVGPDNIVVWIDAENPLTGIVIRDGFISGGRCGIASFNASGGNSPVQVRVEGVTISGSHTGISIGGDSIDIIGCRIEPLSDGISVGLAGFSPSMRLVAKVLNNVVHAPGNGIFVYGARSSRIQGNTVTGVYFTGISVAGVLGSNGGGNVVSDNLVSGATGVPTTSDGIALMTTGFPGSVSPTNLVSRNVVTGMGRYGIWSYLDHTRLEGNVVSRCVLHGIFIGTTSLSGDAWGFHNHLEQNESTGNGGCGIMFQNANPHSYRMNVSLGNGLGGYCGPAGVAPPPPAVVLGIGNL